MKNEKGITLMILIITVIIMLILVSVGIQYGGNSLDGVRLQNFSYELQQIQGRVDTISEKMTMDRDSDYLFLNRRSNGNEYW